LTSFLLRQYRNSGLEYVVTLILTNTFDASGQYYDNMTFPAANYSGSGTTGDAIVYWGVPKPDADCGFLLMQDFPDRMGWEVMTWLPGYIIVNARAEGCYYSGLSVSLANEWTGMRKSMVPC
jgi:hypothetical protein